MACIDSNGCFLREITTSSKSVFFLRAFKTSSKSVFYEHLQHRQNLFFFEPLQHRQNRK